MCTDEIHTVLNFLWHRTNSFYYTVNSVPRSVIQRWACKLFFKSANRKSAYFWSHSAIANPQIFQECQSANCKSAIFMENPPIANPQMFSAFQSANHKSAFSYGFAEDLSPQKRSANHKSANCHICERSANLVSPQVCGFTICGTYLRTAHH